MTNSPDIPRQLGVKDRIAITVGVPLALTAAYFGLNRTSALANQVSPRNVISQVTPEPTSTTDPLATAQAQVSEIYVPVALSRHLGGFTIPDRGKTPTKTATVEKSATPTVINSPEPTNTSTNSPTPEDTPTASSTPTDNDTPTTTLTPTRTGSPTRTPSPSRTPRSSETPTAVPVRLPAGIVVSAVRSGSDYGLFSRVDEAGNFAMLLNTGATDAEGSAIRFGQSQLGVLYTEYTRPQRPTDTAGVTPLPGATATVEPVTWAGSFVSLDGQITHRFKDTLAELGYTGSNHEFSFVLPSQGNAIYFKSRQGTIESFASSALFPASSTGTEIDSNKINHRTIEAPEGYRFKNIAPIPGVSGLFIARATHRGARMNEIIESFIIIDVADPNNPVYNTIDPDQNILKGNNTYINTVKDDYLYSSEGAGIKKLRRLRLIDNPGAVQEDVSLEGMATDPIDIGQIRDIDPSRTLDEYYALGVLQIDATTQAILGIPLLGGPDAGSRTHLYTIAADPFDSIRTPILITEGPRKQSIRELGLPIKGPWKPLKIRK